GGIVLVSARGTQSTTSHAVDPGADLPGRRLVAGRPRSTHGPARRTRLARRFRAGGSARDRPGCASCLTPRCGRPWPPPRSTERSWLSLVSIARPSTRSHRPLGLRWQGRSHEAVAHTAFGLAIVGA